MKVGISSRRSTVRFAFSALILVVAWASPALAALPSTSNPHLHLDKTIRTRPFVGSSVSMRDGEGSAYVPKDDSLWLADDNGRSVYEVNPNTGALKRVIRRDAFESAPKLGGGPAAGADRVRDLESLAYDASTDALYAFSGSCCTSSVQPTVFRLKRANGTFRVESYQPLAKGSNFTGAGWNASDRKLYVGYGKTFRSYHYETSAVGPAFTIANVSGIFGLTFSPSGADLFVVTSAEKLLRVDWATKRIVSGWALDLRPFGVRESRAVDLIGDRFFVLDGYDGRSSTDPLKYAVFVLSVT